MPLSGNARAAAQRDEQQRKYAAVARVAPCRSFGNVFQNEVGGHKGILHIQCDEVVENTRPLQQTVHALRQRLDQRAEIGRKDDVRRLLACVEAGLCRVRLDGGNIVITGRVDIGVFDRELVVLRHRFLPAHGALERVLRCGTPVRGIERLDADVALLLAGGGQRQVDAHKHTGREDLVLHAYARANADAVCDLSVFAHPPVDMVKTALALLRRHAFHAVQLHARTRGESGLGLAHGGKEAVKKTHLAADVQPADLARVHALVEFLLGKIGDVPAHHSERGGTGERVVRGDAPHDLTLCRQAGAQRIGNVILREAAVDEPYGSLKVAPCLAPCNVVRQADIQKAQIIVAVHG